MILRDDDREEKIRQRIEDFHRQTEPLKEFYGELGLLQTVDGTQPPEQVFAAISAEVGSQLEEERAAEQGVSDL